MSNLWEATVLAHARGSVKESQEAHELKQFWNPDRVSRAAIRVGDEKCVADAYGRLAYLDPAEFDAHILGKMLEGPEQIPVPTTFWPRGSSDGHRRS